MYIYIQLETQLHKYFTIIYIYIIYIYLNEQTGSKPMEISALLGQTCLPSCGPFSLRGRARWLRWKPWMECHVLPWQALLSNSSLFVKESEAYGTSFSWASQLIYTAAYGQGTFFFLWFGRCRTKARSWSKHKQWKAVVQGLYWSVHIGKSWQKSTNKQKTRPRRPANPPARFAFRHRNSKATATGQGPNNNTHKRFASGHSDICTVSLTKTCRN